MLRKIIGSVGVVLAVSLTARAADGPVVRMPAIEQGSNVKGDVAVDILFKPGDDGVPLSSLTFYVDDEPVMNFELQPRMRNVTVTWMTAQWADGKHRLRAVARDIKGRTGEFSTFVHVWNLGRPTGVNRPAELIIQDADGQLDNVITSKALIQVKVDPKLGAKWVILYLNDKMIAMMNYPPYQTVLDPAGRGLKDGPYVVRARVVHPDNSETFPEAVNLGINIHGGYTPLPGYPGFAGAPTAPTGPAPETIAPPVMGPGTAPIETVAVGVPRPTDAPGAPGASDVGLHNYSLPPVAPERVGASRAVKPDVIESGRVDLPLPASPGLTPASTGGMVPSAPALVRPDAIKPEATSRVVYGPLQRPQVGVGVVSAASVRDGQLGVPVAFGANAGAHGGTPASAPRLPAPRSGAGGVAAVNALPTLGAGPAGEATSATTATGLPGSRSYNPRLDVRGQAQLTGGGTAPALDATTPPTGDGPAVGVPGGHRLDAPQTGAGTRTLGPVSPTETPAAVGAQGSPSAPATGGTPNPARLDVVARPGEAAVAAPSTPRVKPGEATPAAAGPGVRTASPKPTEPSRAATGATAVKPASPAVGAPKPPVTQPTRPTTPAPKPPTATTTVAPAPTAPAGRFHAVAKGDTVYSLAKKYGVTVEAIAKVNNLKSVHLIQLGQKLIIPGGTMTVDGTSVACDVAPIQAKNGVATSPFRFVVEALGGTVSWMGPAGQVMASTRDRGVITITIGSEKASVGAEDVLMDLAAYLQDGRTMVPVRFISQALDVTVEMDEQSGNIFVRSNH